MKNMVIWCNQEVFPNIPLSCIVGYQYSINEGKHTTISTPSIILDKSITSSETCQKTTFSLNPIVAVNNTVLRNLYLKGTTCNKSRLKYLILSLKKKNAVCVTSEHFKI